MNTKSSWVLIGCVMLAIFFVPLIPNDSPIKCGEVLESCDEGVGYISIYKKFFHL